MTSGGVRWKCVYRAEQKQDKTKTRRHQRERRCRDDIRALDNYDTMQNEAGCMHCETGQVNSITDTHHLNLKVKSTYTVGKPSASVTRELLRSSVRTSAMIVNLAKSTEHDH